MFAAIDGIIWEADADTLEFSRVEGSVGEILGYSADEWLARPDFWQSRLHPDDAGWVVSTCLDACRKRLPHRLTYRMVAADGRAVWLQDNVKVSVDGNRATLSGIMIDVTELVEQSQELSALNAQNAHYRALYDLVPVAIWEEDWSGVFEVLRALKAQGVTDIHEHARLTPDFVEKTLARVDVLSVNRAAVEMFRAGSAEELIRRSREVFQADHPHSVFLTALGSILKGEREIEGMNTLRRLDGEDLHVLFRIALPDIADSAPRVVICEMDVTAAHVTTERLELVTRATSDVIWDFDILKDTLWASEGLKRTFGLEPEAMFDSLSNWTGRIHPDDLGPVMQHFDDILHRGRDDWNQEYRFRRGDGRYAAVRDGGFILRDASGRAVRMVGSLVDITDQRRLEERLMQSQKLEAMGRLTGGIAHDFNNLLTIILGNLETLDERLAGNEAAQQNVAAAIRAVDRGSQLIDQLLSYARQQPMAPHAIDMEYQIRDMMEMLDRALGGPIEVTLHSEPDLWRCRADPTQLESALLNLCINARDAMPDGGRLTIGMRNATIAGHDMLAEQGLEPGRYVVLSVTDTGHGMDTATLQEAFDPFFTTKTAGTGSGLGLSMVQGFARQSGGLATIRSEPGQGTVVEVCLPGMDSALPDAPEKVSRRRRHEPSTGCILVVEDQDLVREHVVNSLESSGYAVQKAASAADAVEILRADVQLDLLLTDIVLPGGISGLMLAETARALRPELPVAFTTGYSEDGRDANAALTIGQNLLRKPFRRGELVAFVRKSMGGA